jgi:hypothetical protein
MNRRLALAVLVVLTIGLHAQERAPHNDSIRKDEVRADILFLAGNDMRGRMVDTPENRLAADFIKDRLDRLGLKPAGSADSFFHPFNLVTTTLGPGAELRTSGDDGSTWHAVAARDFFPHRFSGTGRARGALVFAGFGMSWPEKGHEDFPADQVKGKVVLVLAHEPGERDPKSPFEGVVTAERAVAWRKALSAQQKGAVGILFVDDVHNHCAAPDFEATAKNVWPETHVGPRAYTLEDWVGRIHIPAAQISRSTAESLLAPTGRSLDDLSRAADQVPGYPPLLIKGTVVEMAATVDRDVVPERNVIGMIEGSDPALRQEWVIVSSHLDHDGADGDRIFHGADDNASGTAGMLEVAEAYSLAAKDGHRPRRSVVFAAWNAEERGLLGSWAYTERPLAPLEKLVALFNMDMIGRNEEIPTSGGTRFLGLAPAQAIANVNSVDMYGYSRFPKLAAEVDAVNAAYGLTLKKRYDNNASNLLRRSDNWPFVQRGVPAILFHTGLHPDYHTPNDTPDKLNYNKMERIVRLVHAVSWTLANRTSRTTFR